MDKKRGPADPGLESVPNRELIATASAATTTAATAVLTAFAATAGSALFARPGNVDGKGASIHGLAVHGLDGLGSLFRRAHRDETKTAGTARGTVHHQVGFGDCAVGGKGILEVVFCGVE